ncbi:MAG: hypothetical protein JOZ93_17955 [Sinobacteraceae bacterium]|nr:hypothetical protein [Nevskiaceae bacterium]MBV9914469.1 hypothetical protein [Nevskiaceae bacterium]
MKSIAVTILLGLPLVASAAGPFDGTWKTDVSTASIKGKPDAYLLQDGTYTCSTCIPEVKVPADGKPHKVTGHSYYDELTVSVTSPQAVKINATLKGKKTIERKLSVDAGGKEMVDEFTDYTGDKPASAKFASKRVAAGPSGAHAISGSWEPDVKATTMSADLVTVTYREMADGLKMSTPTGQSYEAKFDGKEYLTAGDPGKTMVSLKKLAANRIEETDRRQGKVTDVVISEVGADGKLHVTDEDKQNGRTISYTAEKQQ